MSTPRAGIKALLESLNDELSKHKRIFIFAELPTGYGKTTAAPLIYNLTNKYGISDRIIHVLPLRAIIRKLLLDIVKVDKDKCSFNINTWVGRTFAEVGVGCNEIAYQMGDYVIGIKKEPLFDAKYIITTIDSFVHNLFKIPITELYRERKHYFIPFGRIFTATVIFDEAHLALSSEEQKTIASLIASIKALLTMYVPVIIMTATLPQNYEDLLINEVRNDFPDLVPIIIRLDKESKEEEKDDRRIIKVVDEDFERQFRNMNYEVRRIPCREKALVCKEVLDKISQEVNNGRRALVVINNIEKVKGIYRVINRLGINVSIIHSRLIRRDRETYEENLDDIDVLVGTSAIEAGVDVSFDTLITVLDDSMSFIQRIGRICRKGSSSCKDGVGKIYLIADNEDSMGDALDYITKNKINWRLPYDVDNIKGYMDFLMKYSTKVRIEEKAKEHMELLREIFENFAVGRGELNAAFRKINFSYVRSPLIDIYVETDKVSVDSVIEWSFSIELDDLLKNSELCYALRQCMKYIAVMEGDKLSPANDLSNNICSGTNWFRSFVKKYRASPIIVIRRDCYEDGIGFIG